MLYAITVLTLLGLGIGYLLGTAAIHLRVEPSAIVQELEALLPATNCGQCGFPGCLAAAQALADGTASVTLCPPGGRLVAEKLAAELDVDLDNCDNDSPLIALVNEAQCIGCTRCFKVCPTDAIIGAPRQLHNVINEACSGCSQCVDICPTMGIRLGKPRQTLANWQWPKPRFRSELERELAG